MDEWPITGVLGGSSMVGQCLIPLLINENRHVFAFSRTAGDYKSDIGITWLPLSTPSSVPIDAQVIKDWLCLAPIWVLPQYFSMLEACGVNRVVALSSTSRFTKIDSSVQAEKAVATRLIEGEERLMAWANSKGIEWAILRPTLIYGLGLDKNIAEIARFIKRFRFFPLFGEAKGLRQPIHAEDVAVACISALKSPAATNRAYNISGGEGLTYREMVSRVFTAMNRPVRLFKIPLAAFRVSVACLRVLPRFRRLSVAMAERMNRDLDFDHSEAVADLGFSPRPFRLRPEDLP